MSDYYISGKQSMLSPIELLCAEVRLMLRGPVTEKDKWLLRRILERHIATEYPQGLNQLGKEIYGQTLAKIYDTPVTYQPSYRRRR